MRILIYSFLIFLLQQPLLSQPPSKAKSPSKTPRSSKVQPPSNEEMQAQMLQAKKDAQKQVNVLEAQLADAKKNNEGLETIQELEDQLATMKKISGMIDQAGALPDRRRNVEIAAKKDIPKYISPIVPIHLKQPAIVPTKAQAKDMLLWYRGKKIDRQTLITTRGLIVRYDRNQNRVILRPDEKRDSPMIRIVKNLPKCRKWTEQYVDKIAAETNSFFDYPQVMITIREFELIEKAFNDIVKNTIALPENTFVGTDMSLALFYATHGPSPGFEFVYLDSITHLRKLHQELVDFMKQPPPVIDYPSPPKKEFELCSYCDPDIQDKYRDRKKAWEQRFLEYEWELLKKMAELAAWLTQVGASAANAGINGVENDINKALELAFERWEQKVNDLEHLYGRDVHYMSVVLESMVLFQWKKKFYFDKDDEGYEAKVRNRMKEFLDRFLTYFKSQKAIRNYDVLFNTSLLFGAEMYHRILGTITDGVEASMRVTDMFYEIKAFNRFALTVVLDYKMEQLDVENKKALEAYGELSTDASQKVYVSLGRLGDCGWQLYLTGTDYAVTGNTGIDEKEYRIPIKVKYGTKEVITPYQIYGSSYSGPREMLMVLPSFRISFCNNRGQDSVILDVLSYKPEEDLTIYTVDHQHYSVDLLQHVNKMFNSVTKIKDKASEVTATGIDMLNVMSKATVDKPTGYPKADEMQVRYKVKGIQHDFQKTLAEQTRFQPMLYFDAQNGLAVLLDITIDIPNSEIEGKYNLTKGLRTVKVEHDPQ